MMNDEKVQNETFVSMLPFIFPLSFPEIKWNWFLKAPQL